MPGQGDEAASVKHLGRVGICNPVPADRPFLLVAHSATARLE